MQRRAVCLLLVMVAIPQIGLPALRAGAAKVDVTPVSERIAVWRKYLADFVARLFR